MKNDMATEKEKLTQEIFDALPDGQWKTIPSILRDMDNCAFLNEKAYTVRARIQELAIAQIFETSRDRFGLIYYARPTGW